MNEQTDTRRVLNVGGNSKDIPLPDHFSGWEHVLLDIDPKGQPDIVCDARQLTTLPADQFDAVYCSHNLEHYYLYDAHKVLAGFHHVLKPTGFAHIRVPDIGKLMKIVVGKNLDLTDVLYQSKMGPITVQDVLYGHQKKIQHSGQGYFAHKIGFTATSLQSVLQDCGFPVVAISFGKLDIGAIAFRQPPSNKLMAQLAVRVES